MTRRIMAAMTIVTAVAASATLGLAAPRAQAGYLGDAVWTTVDVGSQGARGGLVADESRGVLYVSGGADPSGHGSLSTVDPRAARVVSSVPLESPADGLLISADDEDLYAHGEGTLGYRQLSLPGLELGLETPPNAAIAVAPGRRGVVAVVDRQHIYLWDNGVELPDSVQAFVCCDTTLVFDDVDPNRLYGVTGLHDEIIQIMRVTATGLTTESYASSPMRLERPQVEDGVLYGANGVIVAPTSQPQPNTIAFLLPRDKGFIVEHSPDDVSGTGGFVVDARRRRAYFVAPGPNNTGNLAIFDMDTHFLLELVPFQVQGIEQLSSGTDVVTWGDDGVAFRTPDKVFLIDTDRGAFGEFIPLTPQRILDTRDGTGRRGVVGALSLNQQIDVKVTGTAGVPASGVDSVVLNATVTEPTDTGYIAVFPKGIERPAVSNLNFVPGQTVANEVVTFVGDDGSVSLYNSAGLTHVVFDIAGYFASDGGPSGSRFHGLTPSRLIDTRASGVALGPGATMSLDVTGNGAVPNNGVTAIALNVTAVDPTAAGYLTAWPDDSPRPLASNLNFIRGLAVPNLAIVRVPTSGVVDIFNSAGATHVVVDVIGYFDEIKVGNEGRLVTEVEPYRAVDTRFESPFPAPGSLEADSVLVLPGDSSSPPAYLLNVTVTEPTAPGYLTVFPGDGLPPHSSNLNFTPGATVANLVLARTGPALSFYNSNGRSHVIIDVFAVFA